MRKLFLFPWVLVFSGAILTANGIEPVFGTFLWALGFAVQIIIGGTLAYKKLARRNKTS